MEEINEKDQTRILERELWDFMNLDGGDGIERLLVMKHRDERKGRMKRLLCKAIERSSLGTFSGKIYHFGGQVYISIDRPLFHKVIFSICANRIEAPDADLVNMNDIYNDCCNAVYSKILNINVDVMVFRNGVLDLSKNKFYKRFDSKFVQLWAVNYDYVPGMKTHLWKNFINEVLPDEEWRDALQMFLGATFIDRRQVKVEHIVILLGKGANGKSVVQQAVCGVLGEDCVSTIEIGRVCCKGLDGDMAVAEINGRRLNYCTEMEATDFHRKSARLKAIVSGENVTARHMFGAPFKAMNIPLMMANANRIPYFNKSDDAMLRRIYVIPFTVTIPEDKQDKQLGDKLMEEYPGILNWILEGRKKFIKNGYTLPQTTALRRYLTEQMTEFNSVLKFMDVNKYLPFNHGSFVSPMRWVRLSDLYNDYFRWCKQNMLEDIVSKMTFSGILENNGYTKDRKTFGIVFAIFGNSENAMTEKVEKMKNPDKSDIRMLWHDGVAYLTSLRQLSEYTAVSITVLRNLKIAGKLDMYMKRFQNKNCYEVGGIIELLRRRRLIATDEEIDAQHRMIEEANKERSKFNARMRSRGWPYRKYAGNTSRLEEGLVLVSDDVTEEQAKEMAEAAGFDIKSCRTIKEEKQIVGNDNGEEE